MDVIVGTVVFVVHFKIHPFKVASLVRHLHSNPVQLFASNYISVRSWGATVCSVSVSVHLQAWMRLTVLSQPLIFLLIE